MNKEIDPEKDFRYLRPGHVNLERPCDEFVTYATKLLPGSGVLPTRWRYVSKESFQRRHEDLGPVVWAKTASYHMLLINGVHVFRIWTDSPQTALCDVEDTLSDVLGGKTIGFEVMDIPPKTRRKTKPFTKRIRITSKKDVKQLLLATLIVFGLVESE